MTFLNNALTLICGAFLPAVLFLAGAMLFLRIAKYVFRPKFIVNTFKNNKGTLRSLWLALGGTLGVGNICGVASAIYIGGAGCVFWIWISALVCASAKYAEVLLAVKYREKQNNAYCGGSHYYIQNLLGAKKIPKIFCIFCILTAFTMGNVTQVRSAADFALHALDIPRVAIAILFLACVFALSIGKGKVIITFTSISVPILCMFYTTCAFICIFVFRGAIPLVTKQIMREAFTPKAGMGGVIGIICSPAIRLGITRGVTSNEAGCGTAPMAYAADPDATPVKSGMLGICEVLVDTLLLCTLTAYAILLPQISLSENSAKTVLDAFTLAIGEKIAPALAVSVFLFALASVAAWAFYAEQSAKYLGLGRIFTLFFTLFYPLTSFFGCFINEGVVWTLSDLCVSAMAIINVICIILLQSKIKDITLHEYNDFYSKSKKAPKPILSLHNKAR